MTHRLVLVSVGSEDPELCGECPLLGRSRSSRFEGEEVPVEFCLAENWKLGGKLQVIDGGRRHRMCITQGES